MNTDSKDSSNVINNNVCREEIVKPEMKTLERKHLIDDFDDKTLNSGIVDDRDVRHLEYLDKQEDDKKLRTKYNKIIFAGVCTLFITSILLLYVKVNRYKSDLHLKFVDLSQYEDKYLKSDKDETEANKESHNIISSKSSFENPIDIGVYTNIKTRVNTKIAGDKSYKNYDTQYYFRIESVKYGYDNVIIDINNYNNTSTENTVSIDKKDTFYKNNPNTEIVVITAECLYTENFPTNNSDGIIRTVPNNVTLDILGNSKEIEGVKPEDLRNYIKINDKSMVKIPGTTRLFDYNEQAECNKPIKYKWIVTLPKGISNESYIINVKTSCSDGSKSDAYYRGLEIK